ncbi:MAG: protein kinase domain-containing protein [Nannocystales bacterium]
MGGKETPPGQCPDAPDVNPDRMTKQGGDTAQDERVSTWLAKLARARAPGEDELHALAPGDVLGAERYRIDAEVGRGGMGVVYEAFDTKLNRQVALKTHQTTHLDSRRALMVEAQAMAKLSHPHVVAVHDVGEFDRGVFLVADLIDGGDLNAWRTADKTWAEVVDAYVEAGRGLAYAHKAGLVHRDFKPANVLVGLDGRCQVADFGIAVPVAPDTLSEPPTGRATGHQTTESRPAGTPAYMAPEQLAGASANARSDQFSYCVALYEGLFGERPYRATSTDLTVAPPKLRSGNGHVPRRVLQVLERGLNVDPSRRFSTMHELLDELERARSPRRSAWFALGGVGLAGFTALATANFDRPCRDDIELPMPAWSNDGRTQLKRIFAGDAEAERQWPRMEQAVDDFAAQWMDTAAQVCESRETTTDALTHRAQHCLYELGRDANATLASLQRSPSRASRSGPQRVEEWMNPAECVRPQFLQATPRAPVMLRPRIEALRHLLLAIQKDADSNADVEELARRLDAIRPEVEFAGKSYPSILAQLSIVEAQVRRGTPLEMKAALKRAYHHARNADDAGYAAEAADRLVLLLAIQLGEAKAAIEWAEVAEVEAARDGIREVRAVHIALSVAIAYDTLGQWEQAAVRYDKALAGAERLTGPDRTRLRAAILTSISGFEGARGNLERAIETGTEAVEIFDRLDGVPSRRSIGGLGNLGLALDRAGRFEEAQELFERELRDRTTLFGADHPSNRASLINLGLVAVHQDRRHEARARWVEADALVKRRYGDRHPTRAGIALNLAWLDETDGHYAEAEQQYAWASGLLEETLGATAPRTLLAHAGLSSSRLSQGKTAQACEPLDALVTTARDALGEAGPLAYLLQARGDCAAARERFASAQSDYRSALEVMTRVSEPEEARVDLQLKLASTLWDEGSRREARALAESLPTDTESVGTWLQAH